MAFDQMVAALVGGPAKTVSKIREGMVFGRLTVLNSIPCYRIYPSKRSKYRKFFHCQCSCGNKSLTNGSLLVNGTSTSCGCYRLEVACSKLPAMREKLRISPPPRGVDGKFYSKDNRPTQKGVIHG